MEPVIERPALPFDLRGLVQALIAICQQYGQRINRLLFGPYYPLTDEEKAAGLTLADVDTLLPYGNLKRYKAVGDGVTDDTTAVSRWFALSEGFMLAPPGVYKLSTATRFSLKAGTFLFGYGATFDFSSANSKAHARLSLTGSIGSEITLANDATKGDDRITLDSVAGLAEGDLLILHSDKLVPLNDIGGTTFETLGEFVVIRRIDNSDVYIEGFLDDSYAVADNARVQKVTPIDGVTIAGLKIIGGGAAGDGSNTLERGVAATYATNLVVRDCKFINVDYQAIELEQCYGWLVDNNDIRFNYRGDDSFNSVVQTGIAPKNCSSRGWITRNRITGGRHGISWTENADNPGVGRDVLVYYNEIRGTWDTGITTHEGNERFDISFNVIDGSYRGINARVRYGRIHGNLIRNIPGDIDPGIGIHLNENCNDLDVTHNIIDGARFGIRVSGLETGSVPKNIRLCYNKIYRIAQRAIDVDVTTNGTDKTGWVIEGNELRAVAGDFIRLDGSLLGAIVKGNVFANDGVTSNGYGVRVMGCKRTYITGNDFQIDGVPVRTEVSSEAVPVTPDGIFIFRNAYYREGVIISSAAGTNIVRYDNFQYATSSTLTIASGAVTVPPGRRWIVLDTEGGAASDELDTINGGDVGEIITFSSSSSFRAITLKDGTGNMQLNGDFTLDNVADSITLLFTGTQWREVVRSNNA